MTTKKKKEGSYFKLKEGDSKFLGYDQVYITNRGAELYRKDGDEYKLLPNQLAKLKKLGTRLYEKYIDEPGYSSKEYNNIRKRIDDKVFQLKNKTKKNMLSLF